MIRYEDREAGHRRDAGVLQAQRAMLQPQQQQYLLPTVMNTPSFLIRPPEEKEQLTVDLIRPCLLFLIPPHQLTHTAADWAVMTQPRVGTILRKTLRISQKRTKERKPEGRTDQQSPRTDENINSLRFTPITAELGTIHSRERCVTTATIRVNSSILITQLQVI